MSNRRRKQQANTEQRLSSPQPATAKQLDKPAASHKLTFGISVVAILISLASLANSLYQTAQTRRVNRLNVTPEVACTVREGSLSPEEDPTHAPELFILNKGPIKVVSVIASCKVFAVDTNTFRVFFGVAAGLLTLGFEPPAGPSGSTPTAIIAAQLVRGGFPDVAITNNVTGAAGDVTVVLSPASLFSSSGLTQQPYPASEYIDLGVKVKATPAMHPNHEVTLQLEFEIRALSGNSVNGIPIISNRTMTQTVRVKEDEPTLLGGLTDTEETRAITGLPGFAEIPGAGYAFGQRNNTLQDTELLILITPRRLRAADHLTRTIFAGRGETTGGRPSGPGTPQPPPPQPQP